MSWREPKQENQIKPKPFWRSSFVLGTGTVWGLFLLYMLIAVPLIEGQSAAQIPRIDPLGAFKSETAGRWLSLFPEESWQRDEKNRNVIQAKNTILIFKEYEVQEDGFVKVDQLSLLLFDEPKNSQEDQSDLNRKSLQGFPIIVDAEEGAILKTRSSTAGKFGDVEEIRFLGIAKFSRRNENFQKSFQIKTRNLVINSKNATTPEKVSFQYGDSVGTATGLKIDFSSSKAIGQKPLKLTEIDQIRSIRFDSIDHFQIRLPKKLPQTGIQEYGIQCQGPAVFDHTKNRLDFSSNVLVNHYEEESELNCDNLSVFFEAAQIQKGKNKAFFPKGQKPRQFIATGMPATIRHQDGSGIVTAEKIDYRFFDDTVVLTSPKNIWVSVKTKEATLHVPKIIYRQSKKPNNQGFTSRNPNQKSAFAGNLEAIGDGTLVLEKGFTKQDSRQIIANPNSNNLTNQKIVVRWKDRLTVKPDQENPSQSVISIYGNALAEIGSEKQVKSDSIHIWTKPNVGKKKRKSTSLADQFSGNSLDFLLAQKNVFMETESLQLLVQEARVFFTDGSVKSNLIGWNSSNPSLVDSMNLQPNHQTFSTPPNSISLPNRAVRHRVMKVLSSVQGTQQDGSLLIGKKKKKTKIIGKKFTTKLRTIKAEGQKDKVEVQFLDIQGNVQIYPADYQPGVQNSPAPKFYMNASRIVGVLPENNPNSNQQPLPFTSSNDSSENLPKLRWTVYGWKDRPAFVQSKGISFLGNPIYFDQVSNRIWTDNGGEMEFPIHSGRKLSLLPDQKRTKEINFPVQKNKKQTGKGKVKWNGQLLFDGKTATLLGDVDCRIESTNPKGNRGSVRATGDQLRIVLEFPIKLDRGDGSTDVPELESLHLATKQNPAGGQANINQNQTRLYQLEMDPNGLPVAEYLLLSKTVNYSALEQRIQITGPGKLWYISGKKEKPQFVQPAGFAQGGNFDGNKKGDLEYLKVEFRDKFDGFLDLGKFVFAGPSTSVHGKLPSWEKKDESSLIDPLVLTCNWLTLNRWKPEGRLQAVNELNAKGSVHVRGSDFEALASELRYNQKKDLFTVQGDARAAAKFFQVNPVDGKRNRLDADLIRYSPSQQLFEVDGHKNGDISFFSFRKK